MQPKKLQLKCRRIRVAEREREKDISSLGVCEKKNMILLCSENIN